MKYNNLKLTEKFKFTIIAPAVLLLVAIVIGAIFGFNFDYDFKTTQSFNVKFNTTVTQEEYDILEDRIYELVNLECENFRLERIGEGAQNGVVVKIADKKVMTNDINLDNLKETIEENLLTGITIDSNVVVRTETTYVDSSTNYVNTLWWGIGAYAFIMVFTFIYLFIRYNLASAISLICSQTIGIILVASLLILTRLPVNYFTILSFFVMLLLTTYTTLYVDNYIKETLNNDKFNKFSNDERVTFAINKTFKNLVIVFASLIVAILAVMFVGNLSLIYLCTSFIMAIIVSFAMTIIFNTTIWALIYNKEKDTILRKRIEKENNKSQEKSEDKILV